MQRYASLKALADRISTHDGMDGQGRAGSRQQAGRNALMTFQRELDADVASNWNMGVGDSSDSDGEDSIHADGVASRVSGGSTVARDADVSHATSLAGAPGRARQRKRGHGEKLGTGVLAARGACLLVADTLDARDLQAELKQAETEAERGY